MSINTVTTVQKAPETGGNRGELSAQEIQDRFITVLSAQLRNQDPLKPMDNSEITSQMAQLNTVTGIEKLNDSVNAMKASLEKSLGGQTLDFLDKEVMVASDRFSLNGEDLPNFFVRNPNQPVQMRITTESGRVIYQEDLNLRSGINEVLWDGQDQDGLPAPAGTYRVEMLAGATDNQSPIDTFQKVRVIGLEGTGLTASLVAQDGQQYLVDDVLGVYN